MLLTVFGICFNNVSLKYNLIMLQQLLPRLQSCGYRGLTQATLEGACDTRQLLSYLLGITWHYVDLLN